MLLKICIGFILMIIISKIIYFWLETIWLFRIIISHNTVFGTFVLLQVKKIFPRISIMKQTGWQWRQMWIISLLSSVNDISETQWLPNRKPFFLLWIRNKILHECEVLALTCDPSHLNPFKQKSKHKNLLSVSDQLSCVFEWIGCVNE